MLKDDNKFWWIQKAYSLDRKDGKWQVIELEIVEESLNAILVILPENNKLCYYLKDSSDLFRTEKEAVECMNKWNEVK